jgi:membrane fusion protein, multidrug efflux system
MKTLKPSIAWYAFGMLAAGIFFGCSGNKKNPVTASGPGSIQNLNVTAVVVQPGILDDIIIANGSVLANEEVDLKSEATGRITRINFQEGSKVQKGQLLVKIDDDELQAQLRQLEFDLGLARQDEYRKSRLLEVKGISQEEHDASRLRVSDLESQIDLLKTRIDKTMIVAPFTGQIGLRYASEGAYMTPGTSVALLVQIDPLKIEFSIPERYAGYVKTGQSIEFKISGREKIFQGKVYAQEPRIDPTTRTLRIRALSSNPKGELVPGTFASVTLKLDRIEDALMVPTQVVIPRMEGQDVFVYRNGKAQKVPVETGTRLRSTIQISSGLQPGDTVITTGLLVLRDQMDVSIAQIVEVND